jgi:hypothetical protein
MIQKSGLLRAAAAVGTVSIVLPLLATATAAQAYPRDVVAHCAREAQKMPGMGCTTCDNFRDYVEHACEANGGRIPGSLTVLGNRPYDEWPTARDRDY